MFIQALFRRDLVSVAAVGVLAGAGLTAPMVGGGPAGAAPTPSGELVHGRVFGSGGSPLEGASVTLTASPNGATLQGLGVGAVVPTIELGAVTTDTSGSYAFAPRLSTLPASYADPGGYVRLQVQVSAGSLGQQTYGLSAAVPGTPAAQSPDTSATIRRPDRVDFSLATGAVADVARTRLQVSNKASATGAAAAPVYSSVEGVASTALNAGAVTSSSCGNARYVCSGGINPRNLPNPFANADPTAQCGYWQIMGYKNNAPEHFANVYTWKGAIAKIIETVSSSHSVGISLAIGHGGFQADGGFTMETHLSNQGGHRVYGNKAEYNGLNAAKEARACYQHYTYPKWPTAPLVTQRRSVATTFFDVTEPRFEKSVAQPRFPSCDILVRGDERTKNQGTNTTYSGGISYGSWGSASAHASFSKDTEIYWKVTRKSVWCGSTKWGKPNTGPLSSPRAQMRQVPTAGGGCAKPEIPDVVC